MASGNKVFNPEPMQEDPSFTAPADLLASGKSLQKAGTPFVTAITVQKPRDLDKIVKAMEREAEYAGDAFWYSWAQKGELIEGPTIGLANSLAREWTNNAVTCELQETDEAFYITARFIDLEKGSQMERVFRQRKGQVQGKYDPERKLDMALQIGQSKAIRNVIVNSVPRWLVEQVIEKAKEAVAKKIDPKRLQEFAAEAVKFFGAKGIAPEQMVEKAGKPMAEWTTRDIANFRADAKALMSGEVSISDLFPPKEAKEVSAPAGPINAEAVAGATLKPSTQEPREPGADEGEDAGPSPEEQKRIREREIAESQAKQPQAPKPPPNKSAGGKLFGA